MKKRRSIVKSEYDVIVVSYHLKSKKNVKDNTVL